MMHPIHRHTIVGGIALAMVLATPDVADSPPVSAPDRPLHASVGGRRESPTQDTERHLSVAERALLGTYHAVLRAPGPRQASRDNLLRQIRDNPPVAFVDGYWATPIDLAAVLQIPAVRGALGETLPSGPNGQEASELLADPSRLKQLTAFAFTASRLRSQLGLAFVGEFARVAASAPETSDVYVVPVKDVEWVVVEHLPPTVAATVTEPECYFFCGDPETWDFDGDGIPNAQDDDDDNDRVLDNEDDYPYWPGGSACECEPEPFFVFTTKFSTGVTSAVLAAHRLVERIGETGSAVTLGAVPGSQSDVRFLFPTRTVSLVEPRQDCPDSGDPAIRYVDTDPESCARLRFRCREGEEPFSSECGCGCRQP